MNVISAGGGWGAPIVETANPFESAGVDRRKLDRDDFMRLFITQLQHQDPMKPMDSYEMASQLAQFSSMEATMQMSDNMEKLLDYQLSQNNLQLLTLIGKNIETAGNEIGVVDGQVAATNFVLEAAAPFSMVYIYNSAGHLVRTLDLGYRPVGQHSLSWDGLDNNGTQVNDGLYRYRVDALTADGSQVGVELRSSGRVTGLAFDSGLATITISGHVQKAVSEITRVH